MVPVRLWAATERASERATERRTCSAVPDHPLCRTAPPRVVRADYCSVFGLLGVMRCRPSLDEGVSSINFGNYISFTPPAAPAADNCASSSTGEGFDRTICDNLEKSVEQQAHTYVACNPPPS